MTGRFRTALLTALILGMVAVDTQAFAACAQSAQIRQAFEKNIRYEANRAHVSNDDVNKRITRIERQNLDCRQLYDAYNTYLQQLKRRADARSKDKGFLLFKKW